MVTFIWPAHRKISKTLLAPALFKTSPHWVVEMSFCFIGFPQTLFMKATAFLIVLLVIGILGAFWLAGPGPTEPLPTPETKESTSATSTSPGPASAAAKREEPASFSAAPGAAPAAPIDRETIFQAIEAASVTYERASLPKIQPYLTHPDPEVREEALHGIVNLGDAAGAPLLREAARRAPNSQESRRLNEMADYLELPPSTSKMLNLPPRKP